MANSRRVKRGKDLYRKHRRKGWVRIKLDDPLNAGQRALGRLAKLLKADTPEAKQMRVDMEFVVDEKGSLIHEPQRL